MKSSNWSLLSKIAIFRNMLGISQEELKALEEPVKTIGNLSREIERLKSEKERLEKALGYKPRIVLPNCIGCGTGHMSNSVDGFTCGTVFCRDRAIDILVETRPARNGDRHTQRKERVLEI